MMTNKRLNRNGLHVFAVQIGPRIADPEWNELLSQIDDEERARIMQYRNWKDRQRALIGHILIKWSLVRFCNGHVEYPIIRNENGRPYIAGCNKWSGDFNISHSGDWVVLAIAEKGKVGIDIEKLGNVSEEVMEHVLTQAELRMISEEPENYGRNLFYEVWTMKEAIYKTGLYPNATPESLDIIQLTQKNSDIYTQFFYVDAAHPVSVCWDHGVPPDKISVLERNDILPIASRVGGKTSV